MSRAGKDRSDALDRAADAELAHVARGKGVVLVEQRRVTLEGIEIADRLRHATGRLGDHLAIGRDTPKGTLERLDRRSLAIGRELLRRGAAQQPDHLAALLL